MLRLHLKLVASFFALALFLTYALPHLDSAVKDWEQLLADYVPDASQKEDQSAALTPFDLPQWSLLLAEPKQVLLPGNLEISDSWILPASPLYSKVLWARPPPAVSLT